MKLKFILALAIVLAFSACKKEDPITPTFEDWLVENFVRLNSQTIEGYQLELYAEEALYTGYNGLYFYLTDPSGETVKTFDLTLNPMMDMGMMQHTTPFEEPFKFNEMGLHVSNITFIMPSTAGDWTMDISIDPGDGSQLEFAFAPNVIEKDESKLVSFSSEMDDSEKYFMALISPLDPEVGMNHFEVVVYNRESMMSFPPSEDFIIEIEPEMPTMGHGSPNNENPVHTEDGHYEGVCNFTMTGYWKVNMVVKNANNDIVRDSLAFDITF
jgi:hypothetical protein